MTKGDYQYVVSLLLLVLAGQHDGAMSFTFALLALVSIGMTCSFWWRER